MSESWTIYTLFTSTGKTFNSLQTCLLIPQRLESLIQGIEY
ncbi:hypothetical protein VCR29J2_360599 [Vibrio coralliirubri]|nr:hypothetical protein VCR29J2_360599 [Vibrio coralliirubri]